MGLEASLCPDPRPAASSGKRQVKQAQQDGFPPMAVMRTRTPTPSFAQEAS